MGDISSCSGHGTVNTSGALNPYPSELKLRRQLHCEPDLHNNSSSIFGRAAFGIEQAAGVCGVTWDSAICGGARNW